MYRIGLGYDIHRLVTDRKLFLGGIEIPHSKGLDGHSDADVIIHSLCDAMLGALALGDIGKFFPNTDQKWKNVDSKILLTEVYKKINERKYELVNADVMLIAEEPKIAPYVMKMRETLANILETSVENISVKATTNEKTGSLGRGEAIACHCVVLLRKSEL